jgi:hypothetical protein
VIVFQLFFTNPSINDWNVRYMKIFYDEVKCKSSNFIATDADSSFGAFDRLSPCWLNSGNQLFLNFMNQLISSDLHFDLLSLVLWRTVFNLILDQNLFYFRHILFVCIHDSLKLTGCRLIDYVIVCLTNVLFHWF